MLRLQIKATVYCVLDELRAVYNRYTLLTKSASENFFDVHSAILAKFIGQKIEHERVWLSKLPMVCIPIF